MTTAAQKKLINAASTNGSVKIASMADGNAFAAAARAGLLTHSADGTAEPAFFAWVIGTVAYLTDAGRAELAK